MFIEQRLKTNEVSFFATLKQLKLKTFKLKKCNTKAKSITIAAERSMFGKLLIIGQQRDDISMEEVLSYSLSPVPWSLALPDGGLVKTVKSKLLQVVEQDIPTTDYLPESCAVVNDGMVYIQQVDVTALSTFGDLSEYLLKRILNSSDSKRVYFVTDQYTSNSIKGYERARRALAGKIRIKIERREQKLPNQFKMFLREDDNKVELVQFLFNDWSP